MLTKQETLLGRGAGVESVGGKGTQEDRSATWLTVLGFMVVGLVSSCLWLIILTRSFLVVCTWLSQDGLQQRGFWEIGRTYGLSSPFDLSQILPVGGGLLGNTKFLTGTCCQNNSCK